jgi:hypothetical protein
MKLRSTLLFFLVIITQFSFARKGPENYSAPSNNFLISAGGTVIITCSATNNFYDSGGSGGSYNNSENFTQTYSVTSGCLSFNFSTFNTEPCCDFLRIYDGPSIASPLIGVYSGLTGPGIINASGNSLTFQWTSDGSVIDPGWAASISCNAACAGMPTPGAAQATPSISCSSFSSALSLTGNVIACGLTYQWQVATVLAGPYANIGGATNLNYTVTSPATRYYRCLVSCGVNTATSAVATCSVTAPGPCAICAINSIGSLPYNSGNQTTCGMGNNVTSGNVTNICGSSSYYGGEDEVYSFTPATSGVIMVNVGSPGSYVGLHIYQGCPISGGTCVGSSQNWCCTWSVCVAVTAGQTYYAIVDSWPSPTCNQYTLDISAPAACSGTITGVTTNASPLQACGTLTTNFSLTGVNACGPTYQWQSGPTITGPWTNIGGLTQPTAVIVSSTSACYRCLLSCGGTTAASSVVQTTVSNFVAPPCSLGSYAGSSVAYAWDNFSGTAAPAGDDALSSIQADFPFPFCFAGQSFGSGFVSSNNSLVFPGITCFPNIYPWSFAVYAAAGVATGWSISQPAPTVNDYLPRNSINAPWHDLYPPAGGLIQYTTLGVAPNRRIVISWDNVSMYSCTSTSCSSQIKLYETSNNIEIHVRQKQLCTGWNSGQAIMGLHNYDGTIYIPPVNMTNHNAPTQWTMSNTAYKFISTCPSNSICGVVLPVEFKNLYGQYLDGINKLWWETNEEPSIVSYIIDRSSDAEHFEQISVVPAQRKDKYQYDDFDFKSGYINYYKVTAVDNTGKRTSTNVYSIFNPDAPIFVGAIYPNPTADKLNISMSGRDAKATLTFNVYDQFGRIVLTKSQKVVFGSSFSELDVQELSGGMYIVEILADGKLITKQKFSKM